MLVEVAFVSELPGAVLAVEALDLVVAVHVARVVVLEREAHAADVAAKPRPVHVALPHVAGQIVRVGIASVALSARPRFGLRAVRRDQRVGAVIPSLAVEAGSRSSGLSGCKRLGESCTV